MKMKLCNNLLSRSLEIKHTKDQCSKIDEESTVAHSMSDLFILIETPAQIVAHQLDMVQILISILHWILPAFSSLGLSQISSVGQEGVISWLIEDDGSSQLIRNLVIDLNSASCREYPRLTVRGLLCKFFITTSKSLFVFVYITQ